MDEGGPRWSRERTEQDLYYLCPFYLQKRTQSGAMGALTKWGTIRETLRESLAQHFIFFKLLPAGKHQVPGRHGRNPVSPPVGH